MDAYIVVGANYGDEGKGLITDYLASQGVAHVVRHNGGAQAGHTVQLPGNAGGARHVFKHIGAGAMRGAPTVLSERFIVNPLLFLPEYMQLQQTLGTKNLPTIYVNEDCRVTTPVDMLLNQGIETVRGDERHGSCGVGIFETFYRHKQRSAPRIYFGTERAHVEDRHNRILREWVPQRLKEMGGPADAIGSVDMFHEIFVDAMSEMKKLVKVYSGYLPQEIRSGNQLIFESAQGLALDMDNLEDFPHLTPSNTGALEPTKTLLDLTDIDNVYVLYVTRTYMTRHGAGPLPGEKFGMKSDEDKTNVENQFQGALRFAPLDYEGMHARICKDINQVLNVASNSSSPPAIHFGLAVTCVDQTEDAVDPQVVADKLGLPLWLVSEGPTADDVTAYGGPTY